MREFEELIKKISDDAKRMFIARDFLLEICDYDETHPLFVHSMDVAGRCKSDVSRTVAILHDIVEDTSVTIDDIERMFGYDIAKSVHALTRKADVVYMDYIKDVFLTLDDVAIEVKIADLEDHLAKVDTLKPSLKKRYELALKVLVG